MSIVIRLNPVWRTIQLGVPPIITDAFLNYVSEENRNMQPELVRIRISENAESVLRCPEFEFIYDHIEVELVKVSLAQLGLEHRARLRDIFEAAKKRGFKKCHKEIGPRLRIKYLQQPQRERIVIGSDPIFDGAYKNIFLLDSEKAELWLRAAPGNLDGFWDDTFKWVFETRRTFH